MIKRLQLLLFSLLLLMNSCAKKNITEWDMLEKLVRDGKISRPLAQAELKRLHPLLKSYFKRNKKMETQRANWVFPVEGYGLSAIGGSHGEGYRPQGYNFFDGNLHRGHPAHDIFIYDKNQDAVDDKTSKPVNILSMSSGWVVAISTGWQHGSKIRGGNYVWIYDTVSSGLFYYAHLSNVSVEIGQVIAAGDKIGELGRSGKNAYPSKSPTHLHLMYLKYQEDGNLIPEDLYGDLCKNNLSIKKADSNLHIGKTNDIHDLILQGARKCVGKKAVYLNKYRVIPYPIGDVPISLFSLKDLLKIFL